MTLRLDAFHAIEGGIAPGARNAVHPRVRASRRIEDFEGIWPNSHDPGAARCHVFQCADVLKVWCDTIGAARGTEAHFVVVTDERGEPWLGLALGIERRHGVRVLTFLDGGVSDYNAPVLFAGAVEGRTLPLSSLGGWLRGVLPPFDLMSFDKMPARLREDHNPLVTPGMADHVPSGHVMTLAGTWADYAATRMTRRQDSRRKRRKLEAAGRVVFVVADDAASRERLLAAMVRQKAARYIETRGWDGFDRPGYRDYFRRMTERLGAGGTVHLAALEVDGEIVAAHWGMVSGTRFYSLMPSFEAAWNKFSPGRLLTEHLIEWSYGRGLACFDFGIGDESYKFDFRDETLALHRAMMPVTLKGAACRFLLDRKDDLRNSRAWQWLRAMRSRPAAADGARAAP